MSATYLIICLIISIALVVFFCTKVKMNPAIALILGSLLLGVLTKVPLNDITAADGTVTNGLITVINNGFGNMMGSIGFPIGLGIILGQFVSDTGWDHYKDGMFVLGDEEKDKEVYALRPMTCPFQYYVYKAEQHSYRDLPLRYGETSTLFRNEDSGEMHGLTRVRQFTISEGHLIVRPDQMVKEFKDCIAR